MTRPSAQSDKPAFVRSIHPLSEHPATSCKHCRWLDRLVDCGFGTQVAHCNNPKCSRVRSMPEHGCAQFEREPGADDE
jgi:hypothetical protein